MEKIFNGMVPPGANLARFSDLPDAIKNADKKTAYNPEQDGRLYGTTRFFSALFFESVKTEKAGYPVYSLRDYIKIKPDRFSEFVQEIKFEDEAKTIPTKASAKWLERFKDHYVVYKNKQIVGTPLDNIQVPATLKATLESSGIKTVEGLAHIQDSEAGSILFEKIPELVEYVDRAKNYTPDNIKDSEIERLKQELAELKKSSEVKQSKSK